MNSINFMKEAWKAHKSNAARLITGTAIYFVVLVVLALFAFLPALGMLVYTDSIATYFLWSLFALFVLVSIGVAGVFTGGYITFLSKALGKAKPEFTSITKFAVQEGKNSALLAYWFAIVLFLLVPVPYLLTYSTTVAAAGAFIALVFLFFTGLAPCFVAFEDISPLEAWKKSIDAAITNFADLLVLCVLIGIIAVALAAIPIVGPVILFAITPWLVLSKIKFYKSL